MGKAKGAAAALQKRENLQIVIRHFSYRKVLVKIQTVEKMCQLQQLLKQANLLLLAVTTLINLPPRFQKLASWFWSHVTLV
jgi:hypothetical protein